MAYAAAGRGLLGLCPAFFRASLTGFDSRWGILVHEVTHLAAGTRDHAYGRRAAAVLAKDEPERAAQNADNYEYFLETLPR
jgi:peptidyl-Lys metalloendopeptidase